MTNQKQQKINWWEEEHGFFGDFYLEGDNSKEGYLIGKKQSLQERTITEVDGIVGLLDLQTGNSIIDVPCGYGRHSIELAKRGFNVTGCDINYVHLGKAIESATKQNVMVDFKKLNMLDIDYNKKFDAVINMFYSFGFFETDEENEKVLINFYNALKEGGKFLMHTDVNIPRIINGKYREDETRNLATGKQLRIIDKYDSFTKRIEGIWIIKEADGKEVSRDYSVRVYTRDEFEQMCLKVGFSKVEVYGDWDKSLYDEDSEDMMVVATK